MPRPLAMLAALGLLAFAAPDAAAGYAAASACVIGVCQGAAVATPDPPPPLPQPDLTDFKCYRAGTLLLGAIVCYNL